jgi:hypothetical protein
MAKPKNASLAEVVSESLKKSFNLDNFKKSKYLNQSVKFKEQRWIPLSPAFRDVLSIPGVPIGHITLLRGLSDTGKTTALIETAVAGQKMGLLPVFIITEMKWNWEHARTMGFEIEEVVDEETGEVIDYKGAFIYVDRGSLKSIEDVAAFMLDLINEQSQGKLPYDLLFLWDSIGSIPCRMSIEKNSNSPMWNAGAMSQQFANFINQRLIMSRKESQSYTNTMLCVNKVWVEPALMPMAQPKLRNKGGDSMFFDASFIITFGNVTSPGTQKVKATKNGKEIEFALKTKVSCDKNHVTGVTAKGTIVSTAHGFIKNSPNEINKYKKEHSKDWSIILGSDDFDIVEEENLDFLGVDTSEL